MTTISKSIINCGVCGRPNTTIVFPSIYTSGSRDLDARPPNNQRWVIKSAYVAKCEYCGFCNQNLLPIANAEEIIKSDKYISQLNNADFPEVANSFLCKSIILEETGQFEEAAFAALHAAWICDDIDGKKDQSDYCRKEAIRLFSQAGELDEYLNLSWPNVYLILIDLHRRTGNFEACKSIGLKALEKAFKSNNTWVLNAMKFELHLCKNADIGAYTMKDSEDFVKSKKLENY